jgi:hypothetical protein
MTDTIVVAAVAAAVPCSIWGASVLYGRWSKFRAEGLKVESDLTQSIRELNALMAGTKDYTETVPKLIAGLIKVSHVQVEELQKLQEAVKMFHDSMFGGEPKALIEYNEAAAGREHEVMETMRTQGVGRGAAEKYLNEDFDLGGLDDKT